MRKYVLIGLSVSGGILSALAWSEWCTGLILLVSFVPFFIIENKIYEQRKSYSSVSFFTYILPGFLLFSMITLGWLRTASLAGALTVITGITFLLSAIAWSAHLVRLKYGTLPAVLILISLWLTYEYISLNIDIVTPWVNLGNGLAKDIHFIQWYDITGTSGGTLWILLSNIFLAAIIQNTGSGFKRIIWLISLWIIILVVPSILSFKKYYNISQDVKKGYEIVIIQPDFDPYTTKFTIPFRTQLQKVISMADEAVTDNTRWVISPETTVDDPVNEDKIGENSYIGMVRDFIIRHPGTAFVTGMTTFKLYPASPGRPTKSARFADSLNAYIDHFNSAVKIDSSSEIEIYHKSKLVPGVEKQFLEGPGMILSRILPYLGGSQWGYGTQKERGVFEYYDSGIKAAPVICYESVFGKYVGDYIKKGANYIFIITNDGWWKNTNGYQQHFSYASLRAIETRRPVARSGNTGISAFIDINGSVISRTKWWAQTTLKGALVPETKITFYVRYGDWLLKIGVATALALLIFFTVFQIYNKLR